MNCFGGPWPGLARQLHDVVLSFFGAVPRAAQMLENLLTNVECDDFNLSRFGESESNKRIVNRERLQRLERIKVVTESFIGEIQTRADHRDASNLSLWKHCPVLHVPQRSLNAEARQNGCIKRDAAIVKHPRALGKLVLLVALVDCLLKLFAKSVLLLDNTPKIFEDESFCLLVSGRTVGIHSAASEDVSQKDKPLVPSWIAKAL